MKKVSLFLFLFAMCSTISNAQKLNLKNIQFKGNNAVYFEAGGLGISHSLNYDRRIKKNTPDGLGFRVGVSGLALDLGIGGVTIPVGVNYIKHFIPQTPHSIEVGIGQTYFIPKVDKEVLKNEFITTFSFGYRMQPLETGLILKVAYTPQISQGTYFSHWGASIGYKF